ncbi:Pentatricopeptide repeat-containing protein [Quillaja saponaria]|uniref:Pentatricopeptide repeat-containing protein n=1 Tax=Quillaja saponaria TaxID=32244 RepID=A0AAD7VMZ8_QUISA|nr:Pentatricopeptide repeat-containing protein [Quillaja saponaria]
MKLIPSNPWRSDDIFRVYRALLYSTRAVPYNQRRDDSLFRRISLTGDPKVSIVPVLNQWVEEGRYLKQPELQRLIKMLRSNRRFGHALQVSEWMTTERNYDLFPGDFAVRVDLISKVHGQELAEGYFYSIPETSRTFQVYGALLNCYAEHKSLDKAEATMQKMKELDNLVQEMEEMGITGGNFTVAIQLNAYATSSNIDAMEKLLTKIEVNPLVDWNVYIAVANCYLKAGLYEKTFATLKRSEQLINDKIRRVACETLLSLYTAIGKKEDVYRIWKLYRLNNMGKTYNSGYRCMLSSLEKLGDIDGAEIIVAEWESGNAIFDIRIPNLLITAYCKKGLFEKAEAYIKRLVESGNEPDASTWSRLAFGYSVHKHMDKAVETLKKSIQAGELRWKPAHLTVAACFEYLKAKGDLESAMEILWLFRERGHLTIYNRLLNYVNSENPNATALDMMKRDNDVEEDDQVSG